MGNDGLMPRRNRRTSAPRTTRRRQIDPADQLRTGRTKCGKCRKVGWPTQAAAEEALRKILTDGKGGDRRSVPQRVYQGPWCGLWHLTAKPWRHQDR